MAKKENQEKNINEIQNRNGENFNSLFEGLADAIFIADPDSKKLIGCNKRAEKLTAYSRKEILSLRADQLHPKDLVKRTMEDFKKHAAGKLIVVDTEVLTKNKKRIPVSVNTSVIRINGKPCLIGIFRNMTERKQTEEALRQSEEKYKVLFESSRDAIMTLAPPTWRFTSGNPATILMFRAKDEKEFISKGPGDLSPKYQPDGQSSSVKAKSMIEKAMKEGSNFIEWVHTRVGGEEFFATVLLTRIELGGRKLLQATVRDITESKRAELLLIKKNKELERANKVMVGRELKMIELKHKIKELERSNKV